MIVEEESDNMKKQADWVKEREEKGNSIGGRGIKIFKQRLVPQIK